VAVDTVGRMAEDTVDKHMEDGDVVVAIRVEDVVHLSKQHKIALYLRSAVKLPHSLVEEQELRQPQIL
jgi:hypothetical protein